MFENILNKFSHKKGVCIHQLVKTLRRYTSLAPHSRGASQLAAWVPKVLNSTRPDIILQGCVPATCTEDLSSAQPSIQVHSIREHPGKCTGPSGTKPCPVQSSVAISVGVFSLPKKS